MTDVDLKKLEDLEIGRFYYLHHIERGWIVAQLHNVMRLSNKSIRVYEMLFKNIGSDAVINKDFVDEIGPMIPWPWDLEKYHKNSVLINAVLSDDAPDI